MITTIPVGDQYSVVINPIPAAACLHDPIMAQAIMSLECVVLMHAAKLYIANVCESKEPSVQSVFHVTDSDDASASSCIVILTVDFGNFIAEI